MKWFYETSAAGSSRIPLSWQHRKAKTTSIWAVSPWDLTIILAFRASRVWKDVTSIWDSLANIRPWYPRKVIIGREEWRITWWASVRSGERKWQERYRRMPLLSLTPHCSTRCDLISHTISSPGYQARAIVQLSKCLTIWQAAPAAMQSTSSRLEWTWEVQSS